MKVTSIVNRSSKTMLFVSAMMRWSSAIETEEGSIPAGRETRFGKCDKGDLMPR